MLGIRQRQNTAAVLFARSPYKYHLVIGNSHFNSLINCETQRTDVMGILCQNTSFGWLTLPFPVTGMSNNDETFYSCNVTFSFEALDRGPQILQTFRWQKLSPSLTWCLTEDVSQEPLYEVSSSHDWLRPKVIPMHVNIAPHTVGVNIWLKNVILLML